MISLQIKSLNESATTKQVVAEVVRLLANDNLRVCVSRKKSDDFCYRYPAHFAQNFIDKRLNRHLKKEFSGDSSLIPLSSVTKRCLKFKQTPLKKWSSSLKHILLITITLLLGISLIGGQFSELQWLQHTPTVIVLLLLTVSLKKNWLSTSAFFSVVAFFWLHILGARYVYSNVPYDQWTTHLFGSSISEWFHWERNHYDRLVHFCFGLLWMLPFTEVSIKQIKLTRWQGIIFALLAVSAVSSLYEVFEWMLTVVMSPADAEGYNGQQGDLWDAQKDMALALAGSIIAIPFVNYYFRRNPDVDDSMESNEHHILNQITTVRDDYTESNAKSNKN